MGAFCIIPVLLGRVVRDGNTFFSCIHKAGDGFAFGVGLGFPEGTPESGTCFDVASVWLGTAVYCIFSSGAFFFGEFSIRLRSSASFHRRRATTKLS